MKRDSIRTGDNLFFKSRQINCWVKIVGILKIGIGILMIVICLIAIAHPKKTDNHYVSFLKKDTIPSGIENLNEAKYNHLRILIDITLQHQISIKNSLMTQESMRMQTRLSFIALFILMLIPYVKSKKPIIQRSILWVVLGFFVCFYFFDIHTTDLGDRTLFKKGCFDTTLTKLSTYYISDPNWYNLDDKYFNAWEKCQAEHPWKRKLSNFVSPDVSQICFYFFPCIVLCILYILGDFFLIERNKSKKENLKRLISFLDKPRKDRHNKHG